MEEYVKKEYEKIIKKFEDITNKLINEKNAEEKSNLTEEQKVIVEKLIDFRKRLN